MNDPSHVCSGSLSRGAAWTRVLVALALLVVAVFAVTRIFRSREARLWDFVEGARDAAVELREDDFFSRLDAAVRYQRDGDLAAVRRDWRRWKASGIGTAGVTHKEARLDASGADVELTVVVAAGLRPLAEVRVRIRAEDAGGAWRVVRLSWE